MEIIEKAELNLKRHLDWISRYDTKISFITVVSIAMLGLIIDRSSNFQNWDLYIILILIITALLLLASLLFIYLGQYPAVRSRNNSLIFFKTIAHIKVDEFIKKFKEISEKDYLDDILFQIHINAEILAKKYLYFKISLIFLLIAVIPWGLLIYLMH